jgi:hypothetical protein
VPRARRLAPAGSSLAEEGVLMDYEEFERDFVQRTLKLIEQYDTHVMPVVLSAEQFETTLLINSLLGLLVLPKERCFDAVRSLTLDDLVGWGLPPTLVQSWGRCRDCGQEPQHTVGELLRRLRNSVCHFRLDPRAVNGTIEDVGFSDNNGFSAVLPKAALRAFVTKLAQCVVAA